MVCGHHEATDLFTDELGWFLICCDNPYCIVGYDWVMTYSDFLACRRMYSKTGERERIAGLIQRDGRVYYRRTQPKSSSP